jgi:endonuclease/exonuclease/phosphatase family metal-dependent hydrolase
MRLKVMTFNLLYAGAVNPAGAWEERLPLVREALHSGADVIALQEATAPQLADIEAFMGGYTLVAGPESGETRLPRMVHRVGSILRTARIRRRDLPAARTVTTTPHITHARRGEHCAILYRTERFEAMEGNAFWLSHRPHVPGSVLPGSWLPRVVNWVRLRDRESGRSVSIYNAHLDYLPWSPFRSARILRGVLDSHWDHSPQILMGDFNAAPNSGAYKHLGRELKRSPHPPLKDAWTAAAEQQGPEGTYHGGTGRIRWIGRLDRILYRPSLAVERVTTLTLHSGSTYPSDHYPVLAEMRIP